MTPMLFALAVFTAAALLFLVQPMTGKQLLPLAGGTPAVWTTCQVFFQGALLLGYLYAHGLSRSGLRVRGQALIHVLGLLGVFAWLHLGQRMQPDPALFPPAGETPVLSLALALALSVGAPFVLLAATAPLVQVWFTAASKRDPYPLYAASNAGSLLGLLGYPFLVEPWLTLTDQRSAWTWGFAGVAGLLALCGGRAARGQTPTVHASLPDTGPAPRLGQIARWVGLAALTSSLLMSVTTHLTTDIAAVPLLWVIPLAVYLITFIVAFARWPDAAQRIVSRIVPVALCMLVVVLATRATEPPILVAGVHVLGLALIGLLCHGELARTRPAARYLTSFYLWISLGGVLGGLCNAMLAPVLFARLGPVEYPLALVLVALVRPAGMMAWPRLRWDDLVAPLLVGALALALSWGVPRLLTVSTGDDLGGAFMERIIRGGLIVAIPTVIAFALAWRPVRFALALGAVLIAANPERDRTGETLLIRRDFFGTLRVTQDQDFIRIWHGTTQHGMQRRTERDQPDPLMYYHRRGPLGRYFSDAPMERIQRVGVVGLGCGAMAAYAQPHQDWTFYEIDPGVVRIAQDERYFTFLATHQAKDMHIVIGDARRTLAEDSTEPFDLLVLDAFSSDAIPVHLLTAEAFALYQSRLKPGGVLALHLSNRYLDLPPLVARLVTDAAPGWVTLLDEDLVVSDEERAAGKSASTWVFVARQPDDIRERRPGLVPVTPLPGPGWRDDFSNLLTVWKTDE